MGRSRRRVEDVRRTLDARLLTDRRLPVVLVAAALLLTTTVLLPHAVAHSSGSAAGGPFIATIHGPELGASDEPVSIAPPAPVAAAERLADEQASSGPYGADATLIALDSPAITVQPVAVTRYTVRAGDTLTGIAARFGLSMMSIWWSNALASKDQLRVGQVLVIPPVDGVFYTAAAGDTVPAVAARYHADPAAMRSYNDLTTDELTLGQQIMIPNGVGAAIAVTATPAAATPATTRSSSRPVSTSSGSGHPAPGFAPLLWPVDGGYISQGYGCTGFPYEPAMFGCAHFHAGIDIAAPVGTRVVAAAAGTVTFAGWRDNDGGYQVEVSDGGGFNTGYYHLSAILVHVGQRLARGQLLGRVGSTGHSTGPHLYFVVWIGPIWNGGRPVNPLDYF